MPDSIIKWDCRSPGGDVIEGFTIFVRRIESGHEGKTSSGKRMRKTGGVKEEEEVMSSFSIGDC